MGGIQDWRSSVRDGNAPANFGNDAAMSETAEERVKAVARRRFLKDGFEETGIDLIAREARVSKQSLYELYPTKVDLFGAVMREVIASVPTDTPVALAANGREPTVVIGDVIRGFFQIFLSPENMGVTRAQLIATRCFPHLATELHDRKNIGASAMTRYLASLMQAGLLQQWEPATLSRRLASTAVQGTRFLMGFPLPDGRQMHALTDYTIDLLLHGYQAVTQTNDPIVQEARSKTPWPDEDRKAVRLAPERIKGLLDAAGQEFLSQGYRGAKIEDIVDASGVGVATIYRQFGNKKGLFRHVLGHLSRSLGDATDVPAAGSTVETALQNLAHWTLDRHLEPRNLLFQRLLISEAERFPDIARWVYDRQVATTASILRQRLAEFGLPAPGPLAVRTFYTLATFAVRFVVTSENASASQRAALSADAATLFLHGAQARPQQ